MPSHKMKSLQFTNGDQMPALGLGTWKSAPGDVYQAVKEAIQMGYRHIDCALIYENEVEIGRALSECFTQGVVSREEMWITSKLWNDSHAPSDVEAALRKTLADLELDYLDLYLIHWPVALEKGGLFSKIRKDLIGLDALPVLETWSAMEALVGQGLCHHIGVSNFSISKLDRLMAGARIKPELNQVELHPYLQQNSMLDYCRAHHILLTAYSPLGSPDRPDMLKADDEPSLLKNSTVDSIAKQHRVSPAQVLIGWAMERQTSVIPKSVNKDRLAQNLAAANLSLTEQDMKQLDSLDLNRRYVTGSFWAIEGGPYSVANLWDE